MMVTCTSKVTSDQSDTIDVPIAGRRPRPSPARPVIVFVDDEDRLLDALRRGLAPQAAEWDLRFFRSSLEALCYAQHEHVDVLVTDMAMPGLTGLELIAKLQAVFETADVFTVMLTGQNEPHLKRKALAAGATDLLNKPVILEDLIARVRSVLRLKRYSDELKGQNVQLEQRVKERTTEVRRSRREMIWRLGRAAEFRDSDTGRHVSRVARYSQLIAQAMELPAAFVENLYLAAPLHDVGKIGIPDAILLKPGRLTPEERATMQDHCRIGAHILGDAMRWTPWDELAGEITPVHDEVLRTAREIALSHHEHWDGNGYPSGLVGEAIPLSGRIVAVADVYDALTTERVYKAACSSEVALEMIKASKGKQFDPRVVDSFLKVLPEIEACRRLLCDSGSSPIQPDTYAWLWDSPKQLAEGGGDQS